MYQTLEGLRSQIVCSYRAVIFFISGSAQCQLLCRIKKWNPYCTWKWSIVFAFVESLSWPCDLKYEELPHKLSLAIDTPEVLFQMCWGFVGYVIPMLKCSSLCSSPSLSESQPTFHSSSHMDLINTEGKMVWECLFGEGLFQKKKGEIRILGFL